MKGKTNGTVFFKASESCICPPGGLLSGRITKQLILERLYAMTTREFIAKTVGTSNWKERSCSSVFTDSNGVVYSYGYHYPLACIINGQGYVNTRGYSMTTARHINWAFSGLGSAIGSSNVHGVPLTNGNKLDIAGIIESASRELARIDNLIASKKRKNTRVYEILESDRARILATVQSIGGANV